MPIVDWDSAAAVGIRLVRPGPRLSLTEAADAVAELREVAAAAVAPVREVTGLTSDPALHRTVVVDRAEWIRSNVDSLRTVLGPLEDRGDDAGPEWAVGAAGKAAALEAGAVLAWLATKVLGQFEAIVEPGEPGRLLLVAPNIVSTERELDVPARDFRMWVALHEEAHRVQFGAVAWLEDHFRGEVHRLVTGMPAGNGEALRRLGAMAAAVVRVLGGASGATIFEAAQSDEQRLVFRRLSALMALLEGHAEFVMDSAGPQYVPSLDKIRQRFDDRRSNPRAADGLLRRLIGMDAKLRQYTEGRRFVAEVVAAAGMAGFNQVWSGPDALPDGDEIARPELWVRRVLA